MTNDQFQTIVSDIVSTGNQICLELLQRTFQVDFVTIFAHDTAELDALSDFAQDQGKAVEQNETSTTYILRSDVRTVAGRVSLVRIRLPDPDQPWRGAPDFIVDNYQEFKKLVFATQFAKVVEHTDYERIELKRPDDKLAVYFSSQPLSKLLNL